MVYVTMTDKFLSGWGMAENKTNKLIVECNTLSQARIVEKNARLRAEMKYINIRFSKPSYNLNRVFPSWKKFEELGEIWTNN